MATKSYATRGRCDCAELVGCVAARAEVKGPPAMSQRCALLIQATEECRDAVLCSLLFPILSAGSPCSIPSANRKSSAEYFVALHSSPSAPRYSCMEISILPLFSPSQRRRAVRMRRTTIVCRVTYSRPVPGLGANHSRAHRRLRPGDFWPREREINGRRREVSGMVRKVPPPCAAAPSYVVISVHHISPANLRAESSAVWPAGRSTVDVERCDATSTIRWGLWVRLRLLQPQPPFLESRDRRLVPIIERIASIEWDTYLRSK